MKTDDPKLTTISILQQILNCIYPFITKEKEKVFFSIQVKQKYISTVTIFFFNKRTLRYDTCFEDIGPRSSWTKYELFLSMSLCLVYALFEFRQNQSKKKFKN